ncbi:hypothetical protein M9Y10_009257 [Tritrichomonas musculus]|uniref:Serine-threonine/tyrosine-protein kinase catalytic domain-containing protein n=1 Tax=Tritrichomonas musculus TaxID=1915356 RepID=A0ABR2IMU4_9EUKA
MLNKKYRPSFTKEVPQCYKDLVIRCWCDNPIERPSFDQIVNELKYNDGYITEKVNKTEYFNYVNYIDEQQKSFVLKQFVDLDSLFERVKIVENEKFNKRIDFDLLHFFPYEMYVQLKEKESIDLVREAKDDPIKLFQLAKCLIEGGLNFPRNVQLGLKFMKKLINKIDENLRCKEALLYYIRMLIKGEVVPFNEKRVRKLLDKYLLDDKASYFFFHGKLNQKIGNYEKSKDFFMKSIQEKSLESAYECCKMTFKGQACEKSDADAVNLLKVLISKNFIRATYKYGKYLTNTDQVSVFNEGANYILDAANKGNIKACFLIGKILYDNKRTNESLPYFKASALKGHTKSLFYVAHILDNEESIDIFKKAADKGDIESIY